MARDGRPKKAESEKKNRVVTFRLTPEEHDRFMSKYKASACGTISQFIKKSVENKKMVRSQVMDIELFTQLKNNVRDIHGLCTNVNQISTKIHTMKKDVDERILGYEVNKASALLAEIVVLEELVKKIAQKISDKFFEE